LLCEDERQQIEQWGSGTQEDIAAAAVRSCSNVKQPSVRQPQQMFEEQSLTYSGTQRQSNQLAETLRRKASRRKRRLRF
jgi:hypothetical protein